MFLRIRPLIAGTASLTLCLLALANPVAAQDVRHPHEGNSPHFVTHLHGNRPPSEGGPVNLRTPLTQRDTAPGYGLHANGSLTLAPAMRDGSRNPVGSRSYGGTLNAEPVRAGSLRADIARYNAERSGRGGMSTGMEVPRPPSSYSSAIYTN